MISKHINNAFKSIIKRPVTQLKMGKNICTDASQSTWENAQHHYSSRKLKLKE